MLFFRTLTPFFHFKGNSLEEKFTGNPLSFQAIKKDRFLSNIMNENLYLELTPLRQQELISSLKQKSDLSWTELAKQLKVNRSMVLHYNAGRNRISFVNFVKLCELAKVLPSSFGRFDLIEIKNKEKSITVPSLDENLVEFLGFLSGDGCITTNYSTVISCDATSDRRYITEVVAPKFKQLFALNPSIRKINTNLLQCRVYSKKLFLFLSTKLSFPIGKKKNRLRIPKFIFKEKKFGRAFIRGLFDTDGGFHRHNPFSSKVEITSHSKLFREDIARLLKILGFKPVMIKTHIYIMSKAGIELFFATIRPHNFKHLYKYTKFKETGQVPRHRDINYHSEEFIRFSYPN